MRVIFTARENASPTVLEGDVHYADGTTEKVQVDVFGLRSDVEMMLMLDPVMKPPDPGGQGDRV